MAAVMNGLALHGGVLPVGGTFLVFADYCRPSVRLAALSRARVIYSFTHDSVGVGEDGPTHQPVEHVASLRAIPGLRVIRPADANETAEAWRLAVEHDGPTALILSRQDLPVLEGTAGVSLAQGAHVIRSAEDPDIVLVATGSEVHVALGRRRAARRRGRPRPGHLARLLGSARRADRRRAGRAAPARGAHALRRGGHLVRLGPVGRRQRRHRSVRRLRAGRSRAGRARLHARARGGRGPAS